MSAWRRLSGSLYARLAAVLVLLLAGVGVVSLLLTVRTAQLHAQEVRQKLNRDVARHVAEDLHPIVNGGVDEHALKGLFMDAMKINPALEIYLLDPAGRVLAYDAPPGTVVREQVDLGPVRRFLAAGPDVIVTGDDPRSPDGRKVFSAWPVSAEGHDAGFLYIIIGGQEYDSIASLMEASWIHRAALWIVAMSLLVAGLAGLAAFAFLTRPVRRLRDALDAFQHDDLSARVPLSTTDELGQLGEAFNRMADRIVAQIRSIRSNDEKRRELVASISHDLRTPIATLQGALETKLIKEQDLSRDEHLRLTEVALRSGRRLSKLVDDLFELARLDAGEVALHIEPFCLRELTHDVVQEMGVQARAKGVRLEVRAPEQLPRVRADIGLIERVIVNLVGNAIRYTPEGGSVQVRLREREGQVELRVIDTGPGIPAAELPRIFDSFYRVEKSRSDGGGGAGLGLAITRRILALHASRIRVASRERVGTMLAFSLGC